MDACSVVALFKQVADSSQAANDSDKDGSRNERDQRDKAA
jgi:hypothetical protein